MDKDRRTNLEIAVAALARGFAVRADGALLRLRREADGHLSLVGDGRAPGLEADSDMSLLGLVEMAEAMTPSERAAILADLSGTAAPILSCHGRRFLLASPTRGAFLAPGGHGRGHWSADGDGGHATAATFATEDEAHAYATAHFPEGEEFLAVPASADAQHGRASEASCAAAGVAPWRRTGGLHAA